MSMTALAVGAGVGLLGSALKGFFGNKANEENLALQREQFEYQKALQQQIFEREDTAYQRAAKDAQSIGINPMAISGGANAGSAVPITPMSYSNPLADVDFNSAIASASEISSAINEAKTGNIQRDLIAQEAFRSRLDNAIYAYENGLKVDKNGNISITKDSPLLRRTVQQSEQNARDTSTEGQKITNSRNKRVDTFQDETGVNDTTTPTFKTVADVQKFGKNNKSLIDNIREWYTESKNKTIDDYFVNDSYTDALEAVLSKYSEKIKNKAKKIKSNFSAWRHNNKARLESVYH